MRSTVTTEAIAAATMVPVEDRAVRSAHQAEPRHETPESAASAAWRTKAAPQSTSETIPAATATMRANGVTAGASRAASP